MSDSPTNHPSSASFFEAKYRHKADPWSFSTDSYELGRYDEIISFVANRRYKHAFEPGCSIGVLTKRLADHCDLVTAIDFSKSAALRAKQRCAHLPHVRVRCASIETQIVDDVDLLILSEIGYYFSQDEWKRISWSLIDHLSPEAVIVAAHWLGHSEDHLISGEDVHNVLLSHPGLIVESSTRSEHMRLDRLVRL